MHPTTSRSANSGNCSQFQSEPAHSCQYLFLHFCSCNRPGSRSLLIVPSFCTSNGAHFSKENSSVLAIVSQYTSRGYNKYTPKLKDASSSSCHLVFVYRANTQWGKLLPHIRDEAEAKRGKKRRE